MTPSSESASGRHAGRLRIVLGITILILVVELAGALLSNSLALLADAGHVFTDVAGLSLTLIAIRFAARPATPKRTYGHYRLEILAAVVNAVLLFGVAGLVLVEAWRRLAHPPEVAGPLMLGTALVGLCANAVSLWMLRRGQRESLNLRGAYLEVLGDLLGSLAVVVAAGVIAWTGLRAADPLASIAVGLMILPRTVRLLREAVDVLLEATPRGIDLDEVRRHILGAPGVADVHDLHVWSITSGLNAVSAHVVAEDGADPAEVLDHLARCLDGDFDVAHSTFQVEPRDRRALEDVAHE